MYLPCFSARRSSTAVDRVQRAVRYPVSHLCNPLQVRSNAPLLPHGQCRVTACGLGVSCMICSFSVQLTSTLECPCGQTGHPRPTMWLRRLRMTHRPCKRAPVPTPRATQAAPPPPCPTAPPAAARAPPHPAHSPQRRQGWRARSPSRAVAAATRRESQSGPP